MIIFSWVGIFSWNLLKFSAMKSSDYTIYQLSWYIMITLRITLCNSTDYLILKMVATYSVSSFKRSITTAVIMSLLSTTAYVSHAQWRIILYSINWWVVTYQWHFLYTDRLAVTLDKLLNTSPSVLSTW